MLADLSSTNYNHYENNYESNGNITLYYDTFAVFYRIVT